MEHIKGEYAVVPRGSEEVDQRSLFAMVLASPGTSILLDWRWVSAKI